MEYELAETLREKFGVQCGMTETEMWVPIARASIKHLEKQPLFHRHNTAKSPEELVSDILTEIRWRYPGELHAK